MSYQAYLNNIQAKTGISPADFKRLAMRKGYITKEGMLKEGVTATEVTTWLKTSYNLGHGHAMAIYAHFKSAR
ncbi:DUF4287 domain-containing protein [Leeuwenhoekiella sp. A2]|uniref:DUF4287 domain-containing protein n=1 Tax=Leeuwenhoekiella sp. A2 TaxID=3141460 RepID=UPI003A80FA6D|tara:strand:+ start:60 stop:278 length:219 start_codon:yes stop_codon:yes gene_type:complete